MFLNRFFFFAAAATVCASLMFSCGDVPQRVDRPNIVIILADDLGIGDLGCYNPSSKVPTPHLDRVAQEGMRFTDAHSPSAVCTPTRYGLLTGRYCWRTRLKRWVLNSYSPALLEEGQTTLASFLRGRGYRTYGVGKWHLGLGESEQADYSKALRPGPLQAGFDHWFGIPASLDMEPYVYFRDEAVEAFPSETIESGQNARGGGEGFWRGGPIAPGFRHVDVLPRLVEEAVSIVMEQNRESPFFLYLPLSAPHKPWVPSEQFRGRSGAGPYGDFAVQVDEAVGSVLEALDRNELADDTLIVFASDNGAQWVSSDIEKFDHRANLEFRGQKADIWEAGHRVPFLVRWPRRVPAASTTDALVGLQDWLATIAELHGSSLPAGQGEDSVSFLSQLLGEQGGKGRLSLVHHSGGGVFALRYGDWKLIEGLGSGGFSSPRSPEPSPEGPSGQLYNLANDPREANNLWLNQPKKVAEMQAILTSIRAANLTGS
ncbi:MAG TPA: hypothetical protein DDW23_01405 [Planctomycetes bacterium]|nr:hypothetical protein [Planctomycetota bacterium]